MRLSEWLDQAGHGAQRRMAAAIGVAPSHIGALRRGRWNPSLAVALKIERYTEGAIKPADLLTEKVAAE